MSPSDHLAVLAFEAALDRNRWLWAVLSRLEQAARQQPATRERSRPEASASVAETK